MEIELSYEELANLQQRADNTEHHFIQLNEDNLKMRNPTGRDQLHWLNGSFQNEDEVVKTMIHSLTVETFRNGSNNEFMVEDEEMQIIDEVMGQFDPLVNFGVRSTCPYCGEEDLYEVNLEDLALSELYKAQLNLLQIVHLLAAHYNWNEHQILSIPPWRRSYYLTQIEK